ncbi:hypothetical protein ES705_36617 [subsurface metagenome]
MKKTDWQYLVDTLLFLCIVGIAFIGFLLGLFIPKGPTAPESAKYFLWLHRHQWGNIHLYLSIIFSVLIIIHLILSWKWIKAKARQIFKGRWATALILTAIASFLVLFLSWSLYPKVPGAYEDYGIRDGERARRQQISKERHPIHEEKYKETHGEEHEDTLTKGRRAEDTSGILITGRMTLYDLEDKTGIPARKIADKLGVPSNAPLNETIGRLRKRYFFTMQELKDVITSLMKK